MFSHTTSPTAQPQMPTSFCGMFDIKGLDIIEEKDEMYENIGILYIAPWMV